MTSSDGGAHWTACGSTPVARDLTAASFTSATDGWVVGDCKELLHTTDGGATWSTTVADVTRPRTKALNKVVVLQGHVATIKYEVMDAQPNGGSARVKVTIRNAAGVIVKELALGEQTVNKRLTAAFRCWLKGGTYSYAITATDTAGNTQSSIGHGKLVVVQTPLRQGITGVTMIGGGGMDPPPPSPLPHARVVVRRRAAPHKVVAAVRSDDQGRFTVRLLPGQYEVQLVAHRSVYSSANRRVQAGRYSRVTLTIWCW